MPRRSHALTALTLMVFLIGWLVVGLLIVGLLLWLVEEFGLPVG